MWMCSYCHAVQHLRSDKERRKSLNDWMDKIHVDARDRRTILDTNATLCSSCYRQKRTQKRYQWVSDTISYWIAYIFVLPIVFILTIPIGVIQHLWSKLTDVEHNDMPEFYLLLREKQKEIKQADRRKSLTKMFQNGKMSQALFNKQE